VVQRCRDQFDRLYAEGAGSARDGHRCIYIHGVPHRIKYFEASTTTCARQKGVWFTTGESIADWYRAGRKG